MILKYSVRNEITNDMKDVLNQIGDLNVKLDNVALNYNIAYNPYLSLSFVIPAYMWANGDDIYEIYKKIQLRCMKVIL